MTPAIFQSMEIDQVARILGFLCGWITLSIAAGTLLAMLEEWTLWRQPRSARPSTGDIHVAPTPKPEQEINMKKRILMVVVLGAVFAAISFTPGCGTFGNGQLDLPVDVSIEWHDNFGNGFTLEQGSLTAATYRSVKTGVLYELADDGFLIRAPDGTNVRISRVVSSSPDLEPTQQSTGPPKGGTTNFFPLAPPG